MSRTMFAREMDQPAAEVLRFRRETLHLASAATDGADDEPEGLVDGLAEAVERLDRAVEEGWRLTGVRLVRDGRGHYHLDARLAPAAPLCGNPAPGPAGIGRAA